jgi:hypothetical protein
MAISYVDAQIGKLLDELERLDPIERRTQQYEEDG